MNFQMSVSIGYKNIFDDYESVDIKSLIEGIPTVNAIQIAGYFMAQLHTVEKDVSLQIKFLEMWAGRIPVKYQKKVVEFINRINTNRDATFNFLDNISSLMLIEKLIEYHNDLPLVDNLTAEQELSLFKAYLYCSQKWTDEQLPAFNDSKHKQLYELLLPAQMPFQEILELKDFRIQFIKAIYFFRFCENNSEFKVFLKAFLAEYNIGSWHEYLMNLLQLYLRKFEEMKTPSVMEVSDDHPEIIEFLGELSIEIEDFQAHKDFLGLRNKPVYAIDRNHYLFLNLNFLVDKIYQGIQFDFARVLVKNKIVYRGKSISSVSQFLSVFGDTFSENGLFYSVIEYVFEKSGYVLHRGEYTIQFLKDGEPDFYIRDKGKVYLFEFKNVFLGVDVKHSKNFETIRDGIFEKFVENSKGKPKGIVQLLNSIEKLRNGEFNQFDELDYENVIIYPVIVYVDFSFNLVGVNYLLNREMRRRLSESTISNKDNIKGLVMIDLDSLIKFQDLFRSKQIKINHCLNNYLEYVRRDYIDPLNKISTFNQFLHNLTWSMDYDTPKMLFEEVAKLLPKDEQKYFV